MKIAVWHNLPSGGGKRALYYHIKGLIERGHIVESWCPDTADLSYLPLNKLIKEHVLPFISLCRTRKLKLPYSVQEYYDKIDIINAMNQHCKLCAEEINRGGFDVLFANSCYYFAVSPIARYLKIPKVIYLQEPYRRLYEALPNLKWVALPEPKKSFSPNYVKHFLSDLIILQGLRIQAREEKINIKEFDTILVNSFYSRESLLRTYGTNSTVCYLGVDTNKFKNMHLPKEKFVVGIGAFQQHKNIEFIIKSIAQIKNKRPDLVWIGNNPSPKYLDELKFLAKSLNVKFMAKVNIFDDNELIDILNRASIMAYASHLEPFGLAPLEANACGLPVVSIAEGGMRETIIDGFNGLLVEYSTLAMAKAIQYLMESDGYAERLGQNGYEIVRKKWSLNEATTRLENMLIRTINGEIEKVDVY